jgi:hypothetical protein
MLKNTLNLLTGKMGSNPLSRETFNRTIEQGLVSHLFVHDTSMPCVAWQGEPMEVRREEMV